MTYYVYILYDLLARAGGNLMLYNNDDVALRAIHDVVAQDQPLRKHIRDYSFVCIGTYQVELGIIKQLEDDEGKYIPNKVIITGAQIAVHLGDN